MGECLFCKQDDLGSNPSLSTILCWACCSGSISGCGPDGAGSNPVAHPTLNGNKLPITNNMKNFSIKQAGVTLGTLLALVAAVWGFDAHFVTQQTFNVTMVGYQHDRARENAQRDVVYWIQIESNLRTQLAYAQPGSRTFTLLSQQLESATLQKIAAQDRLSKL